MKIGYPCINRSIECQGNKTFRLASYSEGRFREAVSNNLKCLEKILEYNIKYNILFFRISSDIIPFASHPICKIRWQKIFRNDFARVGKIIKSYDMRISMHPDQFTLINSIGKDIFKRSVRELIYHAEVLDLMGLNKSAKIQIHVGGIYGDKESALSRFAERYKMLPLIVKDRLVIENDDRSYSLKDCLFLSEVTKVPVLFDFFHDSILGPDTSVIESLKNVSLTWRKSDGIPMVDYSSQKPSARAGSHTKSININDFSKFLSATRPIDFDVMLEIKDKEKSALKAINIASNDMRFSTEN